MSRVLVLALALAAAHPGTAVAQRFGGQFGAAGGFWASYFALDIPAALSFGRDLGGVVTLGGRAFIQTGRARLGGGGFGGGFTNEGINAAGNRVSGALSAGGFTAEYLVLQMSELEVALGGMAGGGVLTIEERLSVDGGVDLLNRRKDTLFIGYPWLRVGYNLAPFVNAGLYVGYLAGTGDIGGFAIGLDVLVGLFP